MNWNEYGSFIVEETKNLLAIDSPSGMTKKAAEHVMTRFEALGYAPQMTRKDGVLVCLGGVDKENGLLLEAHMDTLGGGLPDQGQRPPENHTHRRLTGRKTWRRKTAASSPSLTA